MCSSWYKKRQELREARLADSPAAAVRRNILRQLIRRRRGGRRIERRCYRLRQNCPLAATSTAAEGREAGGTDTGDTRSQQQQAVSRRERGGPQGDRDTWGESTAPVSRNGMSGRHRSHRHRAIPRPGSPAQPARRRPRSERLDCSPPGYPVAAQDVAQRPDGPRSSKSRRRTPGGARGSHLEPAAEADVLH